MEKKNICKAGLIERGWTESLIKKFLGEPDFLAKNPYYRHASPMKMYEIERVEEAEKSEAFQSAKEKALKRSERMKEVSDVKRNQLIDYISSLEIEIPLMPLDELYQKACDSYNEYHSEVFGDFCFEEATPQSDLNFLNE